MARVLRTRLALVVLSATLVTAAVTLGLASFGGAGSQAVSITGCRAEIEAHGFSHSDFPREAIYLVTSTVDVKFQKKGPNSGEMKVTVFTPKRAITVDGPVTFNGPASMSTCP